MPRDNSLSGSPASRFKLGSKLGAVAMLILAGCVAGGDDGLGQDDANLTQNCTGSCNAFGALDWHLYRNPRDIDTGDLKVQGAALATAGLNQGLKQLDYLTAQLGATKVYSIPEKGADDLTIGNLDDLSDGLAQAYGEKELSAEVNRARAEYLRSGTNDKVYAQSAFKVGVDLGDSFKVLSFATGGDNEGKVSLGFEASADMSAMVVSAFDNEGQSVINAPLEAIMQIRDFVLPTSVEDLNKMKPGESFGLRGAGKLGLNVGAGVPILLAQPASAITYSLVISAALRARISGTLDVQAVKLRNNILVVDVGIGKETDRKASIAVKDAFGVSGLASTHVNLGSLSLDLGKLLDKALNKSIGAKLHALKAEASYEKESSRISMARFRFDLSQATPGSDTEAALIQALGADIRMAQALAAKETPGLVQEFDLSRSGAATTIHAGLELLGMSFYRTVTESEGTAVIQTPGGAQTFMFESLHKDKGWFFENHAYTRVGIAGLTLPDHKGQANLQIQVEQGDKFAGHDEYQDHMDALITAIGGEETYRPFAEKCETLMKHVRAACTPPAGAGSQHDNELFRKCVEDTVVSSQTQQLYDDGMDTLNQVTGSLDPSLAKLLQAAGEQKLAFLRVREADAFVTGPKVSILSDFRIDDATLEYLAANVKGEKLNDNVRSIVGVQELDRYDNDPDKLSEAKDDVDSNDLKELGKTFDFRMARYRDLLAAERATLGGREVAGNFIEVRFPSKDNVPVYEKAIAQSLPRARSSEMTEMVDELIDRAGELAGYPEQTVAYGLLSLIPKSSLDIRVDWQTDTKDKKAFELAGVTGFDEYAQGNKVSRIKAGVFDIDALLKIED